MEWECKYEHGRGSKHCEQERLCYLPRQRMSSWQIKAPGPHFCCTAVRLSHYHSPVAPQGVLQEPRELAVAVRDVLLTLLQSLRASEGHIEAFTNGTE